jgi:hypothetical protein
MGHAPLEQDGIHAGHLLSDHQKHSSLHRHDHRGLRALGANPYDLRDVMDDLRDVMDDLRDVMDDLRDVMDDLRDVMDDLRDVNSMGVQMKDDQNQLVDHLLRDHSLDDLDLRYDRSFTLSHRGKNIAKENKKGR